jgi:GNAT superfamily N-acetyltransferase
VTPGLSADDLLAEVAVVPLRAFVPVDDLRVIERPGWFQLVTPSFTNGGLNEVAFSALSADEADAVIARTIAEYAALDIKFRWIVGPKSAPADLGERLIRGGMLLGHDAFGMVRSTEALTITVDPAITVEAVTAATVDEFSAVMAAGWGVPQEQFARANAAALASTTQHLVLARVDGEPAATASFITFPRSAYLIGGVVLPRFRRRGVYHAMVAHRLDAARARGIGLATSRAQATTSAPLLERLGFTTVCAFTSYTNRP